MRADLLAKTNALAPVPLTEEASPLPLMGAVIRAAQEGRLPLAMDMNIEKRDFRTLDRARASVLDTLVRSVRERGVNSDLDPVLALLTETFGVLCRAFELTNADCQDILYMNAVFILGYVPYGAELPYNCIHYEALPLSKKGPPVQKSRPYSFVLAPCPRGSRYAPARDYPFERWLNREPVPFRTMDMTPSGAWSRFSGFIPHLAPPAFENQAQARAACTEAHIKALGVDPVTPHGVWRLVPHWGFSLRKQHLSVRDTTEVVGHENILPETLRAIAPKYHAQRYG